MSAWTQTPLPLEAAGDQDAGCAGPHLTRVPGGLACLGCRRSFLGTLEDVRRLARAHARDVVAARRAARGARGGELR